MQAIITKFLPCTNTRGSRIKAACERGSITIPYPHELNSEAAHVSAAAALVAKFVAEDAARHGEESRTSNPWLTPRSVGQLPSGDYAHVFSR